MYVYIYIWEFPKIRGTLFGDPYNKDPTVGYYIRVPYFRKLPYTCRHDFEPRRFPRSRLYRATKPISVTCIVRGHESARATPLVNYWPRLFEVVSGHHIMHFVYGDATEVISLPAMQRGHLLYIKYDHMDVQKP